MRILYIALIIFIISTKPAHAYLDPGTGSHMLQLMVGGLLGGLFIIKTYWQQIKSSLFKSKSKNINHESDKEQP